MKLQGTLACDLIFHGSKKYGESQTRMAKVSLQVKIQELDATSKLGADFHRVAFGGMTVKDGLSSFPCGTLTKPNLTLEGHEVDFWGTKVRVFPELPRITPVKDESAVTLSLVLPIEVNELRKGLFGELTCTSGDLVNLEFTPIQGELDLPDTGPTVIRKDGAFGNPQPKFV